MKRKDLIDINKKNVFLLCQRRKKNGNRQKNIYYTHYYSVIQALNSHYDFLHKNDI